MTLLANASGITTNNAITQPSEGSAYIYTDSNQIEFAATAYGQIETVTDAVQYKINSIALDPVDISKWDGTTEASAVPDSWVINANGVKITASTFNPTISSAEKTIITASADMFKDENIDDSIRYGSDSFKDDYENAVSISGIKTGGVKASDDGKKLTYYAMSKNVTTFKLNTITWEAGAELLNRDKYNYFPASSIIKEFFKSF